MPHTSLHAHRVSYEVSVAPIPAGLMVCHRCDNPPCVNPAHLFVGTAKDNSADRDRKGRGLFPGPKNPARGLRNGAHTHPERVARGYRNGHYTKPEAQPVGDAHYARRTPELLPRGSRHGMALLDEAAVASILERLGRGETQRHVARAIGVSQATISGIATGKTWRHVTEAAR